MVVGTLKEVYILDVKNIFPTNGTLSEMGIKHTFKIMLMDY